MFEASRIEEVAKHFHTHPEQGLTKKEAEKRLLQYGKNMLKEKRKKTVAESFLEQLMDPLIYVLIAAAGISIFLQEISDAIIIAVVVGLNATVGVIQEGKARRALEALKNMTSPKAHVIRDGSVHEIEASSLVVGDIVCLEAGNRVPADIRLTQSHLLSAQEAALTGESVPTQKDAGAVCRMGVPLGDRKNMVYMSTMITAGRGSGIVTATGMETQIGKIATMINESKEEMTPLQKKLGELGKLLSILSLVLCVALFAIAIMQKRNIPEMLITAISLAVAAVPEGLPAVVTICLALSVTRMVRVGTIIRKLPAVETLGAVSVVCSDKTGTLTQNRMTVEKCFVNQMQIKSHRLPKTENAYFLEAMTLCNDSVISDSERIGDPTELALLDLSIEYGFDKKRLESRFPRKNELPFDSTRKMMTTYHSGNGVEISYTKGAPDEVLKRCNRIWLNGREEVLSGVHRKQIQESMTQMAGEALRTLAFSMRRNVKDAKEQDMVFLGMVGMQDPIRPEAREAVETFQKAGVDTVMITGDHVDTAFSIGKQLGIVTQKKQCLSGEVLSKLSEEELQKELEQVRVFARVAPEQKVQIVKGFKKNGRIVAMTGDGVNDAPSLKVADIGIAMGITGTDVAKQAAEMILTDDNFATIEKAIEEGRGVYENIRKSVIFLLSSNMGEILTMFVAVIAGLPTPLKSSHILWINLITDSLPALALGVDKNDGKALMELPPRKPGESLFSRGGLLCTLFYGALIACISLVAFLLAPIYELNCFHQEINFEHIKMILLEETTLRRGQTYAFTVLGMSQLFHAIGMRDTTKSIFRMKHKENKLMLLAMLVGTILQVFVTEVPILTVAFGTISLAGEEWIKLIALAAFPLLAHELMSLLNAGGGTEQNL